MVSFFKYMEQKQSRLENNTICSCVWFCFFLKVDSPNLQDSRDQQEAGVDNLFGAADAYTLYPELRIFAKATL